MGNLYIKGFPDDLLHTLDELSSRTGKSKKEIVVEALNLYIAGKSAVAQNPGDLDIEEITEPKLTVLRYDARCARCGRRVKAGEEAYIAKVKYADGTTKWLVWHVDCFIEDKALARLYVKRRQLEKVIKALKKRADELADVVAEAEARKKIYDIAKEIDSHAEEILGLLGDARSLVKQYFDNPEEINKLSEKINEVYEELKRLAERLEEIAAAMSIKVEKVKPRARW